MQTVVKTEHLSFSFSDGIKTLDDVNLDIKEGSIYGFLGPNGAGKTTTLRLLLGLLRKQSGKIELFGKEFSSNRIELLKKIGSLIEQPSLYGHLTARENMEIYRRIYQCERSKVEEVLKLVNLESTGKKKAKQFSLGMKQRLSIAIALLHQPELLVLDEPTNGLDPNGIIEVRELLKKMNKELGITVLVSSHILNEVERMASHVGIIHHGKILFQGTLSELQQMKTRQSALEIETNNNAEAVHILQQEFAVQVQQNRIIIPYENKQTAAEINKKLVGNGFDVYLLQPQQSDLEQLFIDITSNSK